MVRKFIGLFACAFLAVGIVGCAQNKSDDMMKNSDGSMMTKQQMMDKASDMKKQGEDMLAKGKADNNTDEQTKGQKMIDDANACMDKCKMMSDDKMKDMSH